MAGVMDVLRRKRQEQEALLAPRREVVMPMGYRAQGDRPTYEEMTTFRPGQGLEPSGIMAEKPLPLMPERPSSFVIDRFEGDWAVVEMDDGSGITDVPRSQIPPDAQEGDVIRGGQVDIEETARRIRRSRRFDQMRFEQGYDMRPPLSRTD